jgi:hypothetical protein
MLKSRLFLATIGLMCASAPLSAQSLHLVDDDYTVTVQNNRDEDVTVYLDSSPFERTLGKVEAMRTGTFSLPERVVRGRETVKLLIQPRGGLAIEARGMVRDSDDGAHLALTLPNKESDDVLVLVASERVASGPSVTVHNHEGEVAEVFLVSGTLTERLGTVAGESVMTFGLSDRWEGRHGQIVLARAGAPTLSTDVTFDEDGHVGVMLD